MACSKPENPSSTPENVEFLGYLARQNSSNPNNGPIRNLSREVNRCLQNRSEVLLSANQVVLLKTIERYCGSRKVNLTVAKFRSLSVNTQTAYRREALAFLQKVKTGGTKLTYSQAKLTLRSENRLFSTELGLVSIALDVIDPPVNQEQQSSHSEVDYDEQPTLEQFVEQVLLYKHLAASPTTSGIPLQHDVFPEHLSPAAPAETNSPPLVPFFNNIDDGNYSFGDFSSFEMQNYLSPGDIPAPISQVPDSIPDQRMSLEDQLAEKIAQMKAADTLRSALGQVRLTEEQLKVLSRAGSVELTFRYKRLAQHHAAAKKVPLSTTADFLSLLHIYQPTLTVEDYAKEIPRTARALMHVPLKEIRKYPIRPISGWKSQTRTRKAGTYVHFSLPKVYIIDLLFWITRHILFLIYKFRVRYFLIKSLFRIN
jgi:hypothetical protein